MYTTIHVYSLVPGPIAGRTGPGTRLTCIGRERDIDTTDMHGRLIQPPSRACLASVLEAPVSSEQDVLHGSLLDSATAEHSVLAGWRRSGGCFTIQSCNTGAR